MLRRSAQRDGEFVGIAIERAIAQISDYVPRSVLIRTFVVNLLVEHAEVRPFFCSVPDHFHYSQQKSGK
jgi:hypothetical protein